MDKQVAEAAKIYSYLVNTTSSLALEDIKIAIDTVRNFLRNIDMSATDDNGKPKYTVNTITAGIDKMIDLTVKLSKAEADLNKEIEENGRLRGQKAKTILEDGLGILFETDE